MLSQSPHEADKSITLLQYILVDLRTMGGIPVSLDESLSSQWCCRVEVKGTITWMNEFTILKYVTVIEIKEELG